MADYSDVQIRAIPWNHAVRAESGWFRRTWLIEFASPPDLSRLTPAPARLDYRDATSHVLAVVIPQDPTHVRLDVFMAYPDDPDGEQLARLEAETIAYDSLLLQRILACGDGIATINGWERHHVLNRAREDLA